MCFGYEECSRAERDPFGAFPSSLKGDRRKVAPCASLALSLQQPRHPSAIRRLLFVGHLETIIPICQRLLYGLPVPAVANETIVDEVGVEGIEDIFQRIDRPSAPDATRVPEVIVVRIAEQRRRLECGRLLIAFEAHEDRAEALDGGDALCAKARQVRTLVGARHIDATAGAVEAPAMIGALQRAILYLAAGERIVAMRAAVLEDADAIAASEQDQRHIGYAARKRFRFELTGKRDRNPGRGKAGGEGRHCSAILSSIGRIASSVEERPW